MLRLPLVELNKFNAQIAPSDGGFSIRSASGDIFGVLKLPPDPASFTVENSIQAPVPTWAVQHSLNAYLKLDHEAVQLKQNRSLSDYGREERLAPVKDQAVKEISAIHKRFSDHKAEVAHKEVQRYVVPQLDRTDTVGYLRDREIRDTVRAMGDKQSEIFQRLADGDDIDLVQSILRSPMKFGRLEELATTGWRALIDTRDPIGLEALKLEKASIDWAEGIVGAARVKLTGKLGFTREQLFEKADTYGAASFFGFMPADVVRLSRARQFSQAG